MISRAATCLLWMLLSLEIAEGYYGGRGSSRSFVPLGRLSLGVRNEVSSRRAGRATSEIVVNEFSIRPLEEEIPWLLESIMEQETILAATKTKGIGRFLPCRRRRKASSSQTNLRKGLPPAEPNALEKEELLVGAAEPLIPKEIWTQLTGDEYDDPNVVDRLAQAGLHIVSTHSNNGWVEWKGSVPADIEATLDNGGIEVFTGKTLRPGYGDEVPWIKSISKLPFSAAEMADLMMDSSRVKSYNSLSVGREDVKVIHSPEAGTKNQATKIVRNVVQLPVSNSKVESVTLLHTRQLESGAHLLVSRAIGGSKYYDDKIGKGYTLLGVNLFEPIHNSPDECRMTAISHVYSPGVPLMIAGKVGVKSAKNFVKDIRSLCVPA